MMQQQRVNPNMIMPAYNLNTDFAYPMHTNLNLMNLKKERTTSSRAPGNSVDYANVDGEANFNANTNGGMNVIGKVVGS